MMELYSDEPKPGRGKYIPTEQERVMVAAMVACGQPLQHIAQCISGPDGGPISFRLFSRAFRHEIETATAYAAEQVGRVIFNKAIEGDMTAAIAWMKARGGWSDKRIIEHTGPNGGAINVEMEGVKLEALSNDDLGQLERLLTKLTDSGAGTSGEG
ncbi:MAG: hypothetical protein KGM99_13570 [Burkholderiales bacterium]|nr:hypothetical protein [Burkholderiales bacterium]